VRVGLVIVGQSGVTWEQWCALADACEEHGIDTLFSSDHYLSRRDETGEFSHDAWTLIAALAARTTTLRLGTLVTPVTFRSPALLANVVATADHVSGGRVELGLGAGWMEREHRAFGFPFPDLGVRCEMLAEQVEIVHRLWTQERVDFRGRHYTLENAPGQPKPVQQPRPRIVVGGEGKRGTVAAAARFADEYNAGGVTPEEFARTRQRLARACEAVGRDPATMELSYVVHCITGTTHGEALERAREVYESWPRSDERFDDWLASYSESRLIGPVQDVAARLREYVRAGCDRLMLIHPLHWEVESVRLIGQGLAPLLDPVGAR
jgi:F420-dependent oxidoreductase-like protein